MNRRSLLLTPLLGAVGLPAVASKNRDARIAELGERLSEAARFYEDHITFNNSRPYFDGVLSGFGGLKEWVIGQQHIGEAGYIADIAVRFDDEPNFVFYPIRFSKDYWIRNPL